MSYEEALKIFQEEKIPHSIRNQLIDLAKTAELALAEFKELSIDSMDDRLSNFYSYDDVVEYNIQLSSAYIAVGNFGWPKKRQVVLCVDNEFKDPSLYTDFVETLKEKTAPLAIPIEEDSWTELHFDVKDVKIVIEKYNKLLTEFTKKDVEVDQ